MRIALLAHLRHPIDPPFAGGLEAYTWHLAEGLTARGHAVTLFAAGDSDRRFTLDPVIPVQYGQASAEMLERVGFEVHWHRYPMAHQVCAQEIADLGDWLERRLAG